VKLVEEYAMAAVERNRRATIARLGLEGSQPRQDAPWFTFSASGDTLTMRVFGEIGSGNQDPAPLIEAIGKAREVGLWINSVGGNLDISKRIRTAIAGRKTTARIQRVASSAAAELAISADLRLIEKSSRIMMHRTKSILLGNSDELREEASRLDERDVELVRYISERTFQTAETVAGWLDAEKKFSASEALAAGIAHQIVDDSPEPAAPPPLNPVELVLNAVRGLGRLDVTKEQKRLMFGELTMWLKLNVIEE